MAGLPGEPLRPARKSGKRRWNEYKPRQVAGQGKKTEYRIQEAGDRRGNLQSQARFLGFARNDKKQSVVCRVRYFAPFNMPQKKLVRIIAPYLFTQYAIRTTQYEPKSVLIREIRG